MTTSRPSNPVPHGGDISAARDRFGGETVDWLDLSTGISPFPYPFDPPTAAAWTRLPDSGLDRALRAAAAAHYGAPSADCVVPAPGSQALIQLLPRLCSQGTIAVVAPTYGEHQECWNSAGHSVELVENLPPEQGPHDAVVLARPNNPDGRVHDRAALLALAESLAARGGWLVVDEAFADLDPALGLAPEVGRGGLICLRSFGKFFGLAGVRLGFAIGAPVLAERIRAALGPWAVAGPAAEIGAQALGDEIWIAKIRTRLAAAAARLDTCLTDAGLDIVGGTALFRLARGDAAPALFDRLAQRHILTRRFPDDPTLLRFGIPGTDTDLARLAAALK
jgi:cobalamin biosynthetic protein CobC